MTAFKHIARIEPDTEWRQDTLGMLTRARAIAAAVLADGLGSAASFVWLHWVAGVLLLGAGVFGAGTLLICRHYRLQRMNTDIRLHEFCHHTRDDLSQILSLGKPDANRAVLLLQRFHESTVQRAAVFFRELTGDKSVNCCIRIAEEVEGVDSYVTKARSDGLDVIARAKGSQPIPADKGLANALRSKDYEGVFLIPDIKEAVESGIWHETRNDNLTDSKTLMVAPINGFESTEKAMLGIFCVTSKKKPFKPSHTIPLKAIVDLLGLVYPIMIGKINSLNQPKAVRITKSRAARLTSDSLNPKKSEQ